MPLDAEGQAHAAASAKNLKLLIVANQSRWRSWDGKITELRQWFAPKVNLQVTLIHTDFKEILFQPSTENGPEFFRINDAWYDKNISARAQGYDVVLFTVPRWQWFSPNDAWGYRTDRSHGPIELQITANEDEQAELTPSGQHGTGDAFFVRARHEILHALFVLTGQSDSTHKWIAKNEPENALNELIMPVTQTMSLSAIRAALLAIAKIIELIMQTKFTWPVSISSTKITNPFLTPDKKNYPITGVHPGVDYGVSGAPFPLFAVADGEVIERGSHAVFGNYFHLYVPGVDRTFIYMHISRPYDLPKLGKISRGEPCGYAGDTGQAEGVHLHLECIKGRVTSADRKALFTNAERLKRYAEDPHAFLKSRISSAVEDWR